MTIINSIVKYWLSNHSLFSVHYVLSMSMFYNNGQTNFFQLSNVEPSKNFHIVRYCNFIVIRNTFGWILWSPLNSHVTLNKSSHCWEKWKTSIEAWVFLVFSFQFLHSHLCMHFSRDLSMLFGYRLSIK